MIHMRDDAEHWKRLEDASGKLRVPSLKGSTIAGSVVRTNALEWLRLESIRLAYKRSPRRVLQLIQNNEYDDVCAPGVDKVDIRHAFGKDRNQLIAWPPRRVTWTYPYITPSFREAFCFDVFLPGDINVNRLRREQQSGRMIVSIDPKQATRAIAALREHLKKHGKPGTGGQGCGLLRLREALRTYEVWLDRVRPKQLSGAQIHEPRFCRNNAAIRDIGEKLQRYEQPSKNAEDAYERRAQRTLECAREMIRAALRVQRKTNEHKEPTDQEVKQWPRQYR